MSVGDVRSVAVETLIMKGDYEGASALLVHAMKQSGQPLGPQLDQFVSAMQVTLKDHPREFNRWLRALRVAVHG